MELSYTFFHILLACVFIATYILLKFYIIPELVQKDKQDIAESYTDSALTAILSILAVGSLISNYISSTAPAPSGGKRKH
jgi:hypothetical protein